MGDVCQDRGIAYTRLCGPSGDLSAAERTKGGSRYMIPISVFIRSLPRTQASFHIQLHPLFNYVTRKCQGVHEQDPVHE